MRFEDRGQYRKFIEFVQEHNQQARSMVNRRMLSVILWCFLLPAASLALAFVCMHIGILPMQLKGSVDWIILIFPVCYALYYLGREVLLEVPTAMKRGGLATTLKHSLEAGDWRDRTCVAMKSSLNCTENEWQWVIANFRMDLNTIQYRSRYLTGFAGAVFFLILQGIDTIGSDPTPYINDSHAFVRMMEQGVAHVSQLVGLGLFLLLLYLSGTQLHHLLERYLNCAELILLKMKGQDHSTPQA